MNPYENAALARVTVLLIALSWAALGWAFFALPVDPALAAEMEPPNWAAIAMGIRFPYVVGTVLLLIFLPLAFFRVLSMGFSCVVAAGVGVLVALLWFTDPHLSRLYRGFETWIGITLGLAVIAVVVSFIGLLDGAARRDAATEAMTGTVTDTHT